MVAAFGADGLTALDEHTVAEVKLTEPSSQVAEAAGLLRRRRHKWRTLSTRGRSATITERH